MQEVKNSEELKEIIRAVSNAKSIEIVNILEKYYDKHKPISKYKKK